VPIRPLQLYADGGYQLRIRRLEGTPNYGPRHLGSACEGRGPRGLPAGTIGLGLEWVSIRGYLCFGFSSVCLDLVFSLSFSKWRQSLTGLAPRKALKTGLASAAGVATHHAGWLASAQSALERGAQAARVATGQVPQADPSVGAAIVPEETADAAWPQARVTCCWRRRQLPSGPLLIRPRSRPSLPTSGWLRCHRSWSSPTSPFLATRRG
jgi:hypothetical protein